LYPSKIDLDYILIEEETLTVTVLCGLAVFWLGLRGPDSHRSADLTLFLGWFLLSTNNKPRVIRPVRYGIYMEYIWNIYGIYMEYIWNI
jgi:hypothetical protein